MTAAAPTKTEYEAIIGLETHCQLNTQSKIFLHLFHRVRRAAQYERLAHLFGAARRSARAERKGARIRHESGLSP